MGEEEQSDPRKVARRILTNVLEDTRELFKGILKSKNGGVPIPPVFEARVEESIGIMLAICDGTVQCGTSRVTENLYRAVEAIDGYKGLDSDEIVQDLIVAIGHLGRTGITVDGNDLSYLAKGGLRPSTESRHR